MANNVNKAILTKVNIAANALIGGISPVNHHIKNNLIDYPIVKIKKIPPKA